MFWAQIGNSTKGEKEPIPNMFNMIRTSGKIRYFSALWRWEMTMLIITYWQVHTYLSCYFLFPVHYHRYLITNIKECYNVHTYNTMRTKQIGSRPLFFTCLFPIFYVICQSFVKTLIHYFLDSIKYENFKTTSNRFWSHSVVHECYLCM